MASKSNMCSIHPTENIQMYCSDCDHASCLKCVFGPHRGHHFDSIEDVVLKKRDEITKFLTTFDGIISSFTSALNSVKKNHEGYTREIDTLTERVNIKREEWKKQIDEIEDTVISQMNILAGKDLEELKKRQTALTKNVAELKEFLKACKEREKTADDISIVNLIAEFKQKEKLQPNPCPVPTDVCPPQFVGDRIDTSHLREVFGRMVRDDDEAASDFVGSVNQDVKPNIHTTTIVTITPVLKSTCVSAVGEDRAWIGYRYVGNTICLLSKGGQVIQKVDLRFKTGDLTTTNKGEVLVTDYTNQQVKKYTKDGQYVSIMNTSPYKPKGLCTASDNDILVCLWHSETDNKVTRRTTTGQTKQTVQYDKQNKLLFTDPYLVQENINKDICVVNYVYNNTTLVVVNKNDELRFRYPDKSAHSNSIRHCEGVR